MLATGTNPQTESGMNPPAQPLIEVRDLKVQFDARRPDGGKVLLKAVDGISFSINAGETFALVGESGSGKTVTGKAVLQITRPNSGSVRFAGRELTTLKGRALATARTGMQIIFQNPFSSLDPRRSVGAIIAEPMRLAGRFDRAERRARVAALIERVGLPSSTVDELPTNFSGGQRQRIAIARALAAEANFIVCDEPLSAIDVSLQAQILALLQEVKREFGVTYLFISHDLGVVRFIADHIAVMYLGTIVEHGPAEQVFTSPRHPYTRALIAAVPIPDPDIEQRRKGKVLIGEIPDPTAARTGCPFTTRCPFAQARCASEVPLPQVVSEGHEVACHFWRELPAPLTFLLARDADSSTS